MTTITKAIKLLEIGATTAYPIVSAYEYEYLKTDEAVRGLTQDATIYFILQRPLMFFDNLDHSEGILSFDIVDGINPRLHCTVDTAVYGLGPDEEFKLEAHWYRSPSQVRMPFTDVAAYKLLRANGDFIVWETPQKLLYSALARGLRIQIEGNVAPYLEYRVHYIGKAFDLKMWKRLTGHHKLQKALTLEEPLSKLTTRPALEISILTLSIERVSDSTMTSYFEGALPEGVKPIITELDLDDDAAVDQFFKPLLSLGDKAITNEIEAMLIKQFKPVYNGPKFNNYPNITNGARAAGYSNTELVITRMPAELFTEQYRQRVIR